MSYLEIYNETLYDLLNPNYLGEEQQTMAIQEDERGQILVKGLTQKVIILYLDMFYRRRSSQHAL